MRILCESLGFGEGDHFGGSARVSAANARALAARGHEVVFLCTNRKDKVSRLHPGYHRTKRDGVDVVYLDTMTIPFWPGGFGPHYAKIPQEIAAVAGEADVVHLYEFRSFLSGQMAIAAIQNGIPFVVHPQGTFLRHDARRLIKRLYDRIWGRRLIRKAARFVACTQTEADAFRVGGVEADRISIVPNGIDIEAVEPLPARGEFRRRMGWEPDLPLCVSVGRVNPTKGFDLMVRAMARVPAPAKYVIVGPEERGEGASLARLAAQLGLGQRVVLTGALPQTRDVLAAVVDADIFVVPSRHEAFGQVILEAALARRPMVLTTGCNAARDFENKAALVVPPQPEELANACNRLFADPVLRQQLGNTGYCMVQAEYRIELIAERLESIYRSIGARGDDSRGEWLGPARTAAGSSTSM